MKNLYTTVQEKAGGAAPSLLKHLDAAGLSNWKDLSREGLYDFRDEVLASVAQSTARTIFAELKSILNRYRDSAGICKDFSSILVAKQELPRCAYLTPEELTLFEDALALNDKERIVKAQSLVEAYTGARISDIENFTRENCRNGMLTYTSRKTGVTATIPISKKTEEWLIYAQEHREDAPNLGVRNRTIRSLCQRAGINTPVKVFKAGKEQIGPKYKFISSHSFRRTFVTNLVVAGVPLADTSRMAGHSNISTTQRYICDHPIAVPEAAKAYLGL